MEKALTGLADAFDNVGQAFVQLASAIDVLIDSINEDDEPLVENDPSDEVSPGADAAPAPDAAPAAAAADAVQAGADPQA